MRSAAVRDIPRSPPASALQADPERSIGDYLTSGMAPALERLHKRLMLAPFKPTHAGKPKEKARQPASVIANKFFNGRFYKCSRIILAEDFKQYFSERTAALLTFVPAAEIEDGNERNSAMRHFVELREGRALRTTIAFPQEPKASSASSLPDPENIGQELPTQPCATPAGPRATPAGLGALPPSNVAQSNAASLHAASLLDGATDGAAPAGELRCPKPAPRTRPRALCSHFALCSAQQLSLSRALHPLSCPFTRPCR